MQGRCDRSDLLRSLLIINNSLISCCSTPLHNMGGLSLCPTHFLINSFYDPCTTYPIATLILTFNIAICGTWAYRSTFDYTRLPFTDVPSSTTQTFIARTGLLTCLVSYIKGIQAIFILEMVTLIVIGWVRNLWVVVMFLWAMIASIAFVVNRIVLSNEIRKDGTFSLTVMFLFRFLTLIFWAVFFILELFLFVNFIPNALSTSKSIIDPFDQYLLALWILRFILTSMLAITVFLVHPFIRIPTSMDDLEANRANAQQSGSSSLLKSASSKIKSLLPFLWPKGNIGLQVLVGLIFVCLLSGRVLVVLVPFQYKKIINQLTESKFPVKDVILFCLFRFLQSGTLSNIQSFLWLPVGQFTTRNLSVKMFEHLHSLSLRWHVSRKTGEVLRILDRGTSSIVSLLQMLLFTLLPVLIDISIAILYFIIELDVYFGVIVFVTMGIYIFATILLTEWRLEFRREMITLDNRTTQMGVDSLLNFETVKYYGAEKYEVQRYDKAVANYNKADFKANATLQLLNVTQNFVISTGLFIGSLLCAYRVYHGVLTIGDFTLFYTYIIQLYGPLNWFGSLYRVIQQNLMDMEKMLDLFDEEADVRDRPNAKELAISGGQVDFDNVEFSYAGNQPALKKLCLTIPAGKTVALVGPSGGGKSTTLKLLFRFFDVTSGSITIDKQDLRDVTQTSLRKAIGVVPQDPVMFNDTLMYNIRYARPTATDEEVFAASKAAQIHDKIQTFPQKYDTVVGERGLRLSGGERQRVAIARTILKNPSLILLDEATSSLDSSTEREIQAALHDLCIDKTTLVIAHRLSTVMSADAIAVLKDGNIAEVGTHAELLQLGGAYHELWTKQLSNDSTTATVAAHI